MQTKFAWHVSPTKAVIWTWNLHKRLGSDLEKPHEFIIWNACGWDFQMFPHFKCQTLFESNSGDGQREGGREGGFKRKEKKKLCKDVKVMEASRQVETMEGLQRGVSHLLLPTLFLQLLGIPHRRQFFLKRLLLMSLSQMNLRNCLLIERFEQLLQSQSWKHQIPSDFE